MVEMSRMHAAVIPSSLYNNHHNHYHLQQYLNTTTAALCQQSERTTLPLSATPNLLIYQSLREIVHCA